MFVTPKIFKNTYRLNYYNTLCEKCQPHARAQKANGDVLLSGKTSLKI